MLLISNSGDSFTQGSVAVGVGVWRKNMLNFVHEAGECSNKDAKIFDEWIKNEWMNR